MKVGGSFLALKKALRFRRTDAIDADALARQQSCQIHRVGIRGVRWPKNRLRLRFGASPCELIRRARLGNQPWFHQNKQQNWSEEFHNPPPSADANRVSRILLR